MMPKRSLFLNGTCRNGHRLTPKTLAVSQQARGTIRFCRLCTALSRRLTRFNQKAEQRLSADMEANA